MVRPIACVLILSIKYLSSVAQEDVINIPAIADSITQAIHLTSKSLIKTNTILLQWSAPGTNAFYIIERSIDLSGFEMIGVIKAKTVNSNFEFIDEKPSVKRNYYRVKVQVSNEKTIYSDTVSAASSDSVFCKFYPNPVDKLLIVRSDYTAGLTITDIMGKTRLIQKLRPGVQILDVSCLEKNIYVITIFQEESKHFITRKLIKN